MMNVPIAWYGSTKEKPAIATTSSRENVLVNRLPIHLRRAKPVHEKMLTVWMLPYTPGKFAFEYVGGICAAPDSHTHFDKTDTFKNLIN